MLKISKAFVLVILLQEMNRNLCFKFLSNVQCNNKNVRSSIRKVYSQSNNKRQS